MGKDSTAAEPQRPRHIAIIMDGNGRWAYRHHLPRVAGHRRGAEVVRELVTACVDLGIPYLTLFAFSSENWRRPRMEVRLLMGLFRLMLRREVHRLHEANVRLRIIGERTALDPDIRKLVADAEALTADNTVLTMSIAVNYGGRWDITQAARHLAAEVAAGRLGVDDIDEAHLGAMLALSDEPEPDLLIRTGGEERISNFLLWQMAYAEFYFTDILWPDFNRAALERALHSFAHRQRRFGRTGDQVTEEPCATSG